MSNRSRYAKLQEQHQQNRPQNQPINNQLPQNQINPVSHQNPVNPETLPQSPIGYANPYSSQRPVNPVMGSPANIGNLMPQGSGLLPHSPNQVTNLNPLPGINNVNQAKPATTPSGPLDYRKLPNPTKGFGDKAQRRITTLMTPKYETQTGSPLPRAESEYVVDDAWNCSPKFIRPTMYHVPISNDLRKTVGIPLGLIISPLAEQHPDEQGIPLVDHGIEGPIRCSRCRAYINPYVTWNQSGSQYTCQFCGHCNEVPLSYACPMVGSQRQDISQRPELWKGTVEFVATEMYKTRVPTIPIYLFVIDTSYASSANGLVYAFCSAMQRILPSLFAESNIPIGFITYDDRVSVYLIDPALPSPSVAVMPDINKPFSPSTAKSVLQPYTLAQKNIDTLLNLIPQIVASNNSTGVASRTSCLGAALQVAMKTLTAANSIGKIYLLSAGLPELGVGKIAKRFQNPESDQEKQQYQPQSQFYSEMGTICVKNGISVDLFIGASQYSDITTLGETSRMTGGQIYYYPSFNIHNHGEQLFRELYRNMARESGYDALLRVRTSSGINQDFESGHYIKSSETDLALTHISCDSSIYLEFQIDEKLKENDATYFQCAYLYTNKNGVRVIRIHNLKLYATAAIPKIFKGADLDAVLNCLIRKAIASIPKENLKSCRANFLKNVTDILASYRAHCVAKSSNMGQLILPEALRFLPIYTLGILKSNLFGQLKPGSLYPVLDDSRAYLISMFKSMCIRDQATFIYPLLYKIHSLAEHPLFGSADEYGNVFFPGMARPTVKEFHPNNILLIDTLDKLFLWIGKEVDPSLIEDLLSPEENSPEVFNLLIPLSKKETDLSERLFGILSSRQLQRMLSPDIFIIRQGSSMETHLVPYLVEDVHSPPREPKDMDYTEFLRHIHNMITNKNKS